MPRVRRSPTAPDGRLVEPAALARSTPMVTAGSRSWPRMGGGAHDPTRLAALGGGRRARRSRRAPSSISSSWVRAPSGHPAAVYSASEGFNTLVVGWGRDRRGAGDVELVDLATSGSRAVARTTRTARAVGLRAGVGLRCARRVRWSRFVTLLRSRRRRTLGRPLGPVVAFAARAVLLARGRVPARRDPRARGPERLGRVLRRHRTSEASSMSDSRGCSSSVVRTPAGRLPCISPVTQRTSPSSCVPARARRGLVGLPRAPGGVHAAPRRCAPAPRSSSWRRRTTVRSTSCCATNATGTEETVEADGRCAHDRCPSTYRVAAERCRPRRPGSSCSPAPARWPPACGRWRARRSRWRPASRACSRPATCDTARCVEWRRQSVKVRWPYNCFTGLRSTFTQAVETEDLFQLSPLGTHRSPPSLAAGAWRGVLARTFRLDAIARE